MPEAGVKGRDAPRIFDSGALFAYPKAKQQGVSMSTVTFQGNSMQLEGSLPPTI